MFLQPNEATNHIDMFHTYLTKITLTLHYIRYQVYKQHLNTFIYTEALPSSNQRLVYLLVTFNLLRINSMLHHVLCLNIYVTAKSKSRNK